MFITRKGEKLEVPGQQPETGDKAASFSLKDLQDRTYTLADFNNGKPTILSVIPNINTRVCALQTKRFNQEASQLDDINFVTISNNTKEDQAKWCGQEGVDMIMLHDPENTFGQTYYIYIPEADCFARSIFVLDQNGTINYEEITPEMSDEPDYQKALEAAKALI
ncbi:thiol peroxidase [Tetragenococcus koreensis]|uniref:thiol peroxidase n=1 Tax=Tetragenococcus koreensis TaxID=290335 RepID=UPI001F1A4CB7|nr:thiol peroxidase [Tetragenococcus koreensis]MCF1617681.1 thiol peroxidase [Tetragenococcus koreensis]MCF1622516.1 thiol peroxidase [Tetragenococcus koreensis]MCF1627641.1 thiol peroxidase [Tetragenococcus koreensis]MCF1630926.1 thiol peroxidase [Tetragenococcus koreensis]MCF1678634.1 thiol peroxidase [Tetragenococcus koreensis]